MDFAPVFELLVLIVYDGVCILYMYIRFKCTITTYLYIFIYSFLTKSHIRSDGCRIQMGEKAIRKITLLDRSAEYNRFFGSTISINFTGRIRLKSFFYAWRR